MRRFSMILAVGGASLAAFSCGVKPTWTPAEIELISRAGDVMNVVTATPSELCADADSSSILLSAVGNDETGILRMECGSFSAEDLASEQYSELARKMVATVTSPEQDGVGIAGPQVGLSRRIVAVQRFDKDGEPFEVYPNIRIAATRGEKSEGPEGCLSVPGFRGVVMRYRDIDITYSVLDGIFLRDTTETVEGFTAVIFQHECDHLDGILYTDKAETVGRRD